MTKIINEIKYERHTAAGYQRPASSKKCDRIVIDFFKVLLGITIGYLWAAIAYGKIPF